MTPQYLESLKQTKKIIDDIKEELKKLLPHEVTSYHWVRQKISPCPWEDTWHWYDKQEKSDSKIELILDAIVSLTACQEKLNGTIVRHKPIGSLSLPKTRRTPEY